MDLSEGKLSSVKAQLECADTYAPSYSPSEQPTALPTPSPSDQGKYITKSSVKVSETETWFGIISVFVIKSETSWCSIPDVVAFPRPDLPSESPTESPSYSPTSSPTSSPSDSPSDQPTENPTEMCTALELRFTGAGARTDIDGVYDISSGRLILQHFVQ